MEGILTFFQISAWVALGASLLSLGILSVAALILGPKVIDKTDW